MRSVLLGNGINIQFGGFAYNSDFIMKRIKYSARLDRYEKLFENKITGDEIEKLLVMTAEAGEDEAFKYIRKRLKEEKKIKGKNKAGH